MSKLLSSVLLPIALATTACMSSEPPTGAREADLQAKLAERREVAGATAFVATDATDAYLFWDGAVRQYESLGAIAGQNRFHHLDIWTSQSGQLVLTPGTYVDDGLSPEPSTETAPIIDLLACDSDVMEPNATCRSATRIQVTVAATDDPAVQRIDYLATMPGDTDPSVSGSFLAREGEWRLKAGPLQ